MSDSQIIEHEYSGYNFSSSGIWSTVAEWHFLWSRRSTTKPPRLDLQNKCNLTKYRPQFVIKKYFIYFFLIMKNNCRPFCNILAPIKGKKALSYKNLISNIYTSFSRIYSQNCSLHFLPPNTKINSCVSKKDSNINWCFLLWQCLKNNSIINILIQNWKSSIILLRKTLSNQIAESFLNLFYKVNSKINKRRYPWKYVGSTYKSCCWAKAKNEYPETIIFM